MNDINDLRAVLFDTLRSLKDKEDPLEIERAKAINETAQTIINSAKVEVDFARTTGQAVSSRFLPPPVQVQPDGEQPTATGVKSTTHIPGATVTTHRLR